MQRIVLIAALSIFSFLLSGQEGEKCLSTIQNHELMLNANPDYKEHFNKWQKSTLPLIKARRENKNPTCTNGPLIIPVAIHFDSGMVPASQEACAITIVEEQIAELNNEFIGQDIDAGLINQFTSCFGTGILGDACMEFCIADQNHPTGYGLSDGDLAITFGQLNFNVPGGNFTPVNSDWAGYVNIYVDNLSGGLLGVSNGIPGNFNGDGVLMDNCVFGTGAINCPGVQTTGSSGCFAAYDEGETLAHEIGHYFGLFHIWGDNSNCNGSQDNIPDTPDMTSNYSGYSACTNHTSCSNLPQTCGSEDMYMNFMSYASDGCMYMFTSDQSDVLNATAVSEGYTTSSTKCSGSGATPPVANFSPTGNFTTCDLECISYSDLSTGSPTTWSWTFTVTSGDLVLDINSSTNAFPDVCLDAGTSGIIETTLIVTNAGGTDQITQDLVVTVQTPFLLYADMDADEFGDPNDQISSCNPVQGYVADNTDCDDTNALINPNATEVCDNVDNNCDGNVDEGLLNTYYIDGDEDGYGDPNSPVLACTLPSGHVTDNTDCDDTNMDINPGATEVCDGIDNNCDGNIDEGNTLNTYYADTDGDGFGDPNNSLQACTAPANYVSDDTDCDDTDPNINPSATEVCDGIDNNCDGNIDEGTSLSTYYADTDGDGFGDPNSSLQACTAPANYVTDNTDCDDTDIAINPAAMEVCDGVDNNCDGNIDEGVLSTYYADTDNDGFGDANNSTQACAAPANYVSDNTDCDDSDANNYPGNTEICDGQDNNCDGVVDEGCSNLPPCDNDYLIINNITQSVYRAEINVMSDAIINSNNILFTAGTDIDLVAPFEVALGNDFEARIEPCVSTANNRNDVESRLANDQFDLKAQLENVFHQSENQMLLTITKDTEKVVYEAMVSMSNYDGILKSIITKLDKGAYHLEISKANKSVNQNLFLIK